MEEPVPESLGIRQNRRRHRRGRRNNGNAANRDSMMQHHVKKVGNVKTSILVEGNYEMNTKGVGIW
jgi:hypothetical protein